MKYLVSRWHLGPCKHAITLVIWRAPRISHDPGSGAPGALDYMRPSWSEMHLFAKLALTSWWSNVSPKSPFAR